MHEEPQLANAVGSLIRLTQQTEIARPALAREK
jgi:hypothetical protein